ncbi:hypothetical protein M3M39_01480 [Fructilactobacillus hinvesii]|uniref:Lipoprotein n=1 Tax=Fructilactobacillus hinvesii TaxID=2940300 RepID=A0ABY5BSU0_9LACO|nr:hypothetical protein [Fructilactobacillus hinvesii]USS88180.1 hypothetical protein M3M39_01480 [Fructilactobacillus hinvesii]
MKKKGIVIIPIALTLLISLSACNNTKSKSVDSQTKTEHKQAKQKKTKEKKNEQKSNKDTKNNSNQSKDQNDQNQTTNSTSDDSKNNSNNDNSKNEQKNGNNDANNNSSNTTSSQDPRSLKNEQNGIGNTVTTPEAAINILRNGLGNNPDYIYELLSTDNNMYEIQVISKSIHAQGGSGTIGIYDVMQDGTYSLRS